MVIFLMLYSEPFSESFGPCDYYGSCINLCPADAPCNVECKSDQQCRYADWVLSKTSKIGN